MDCGAERLSYEKVKDSGERQQFASGAVRDTQRGKGRFDLLAMFALERLAKHYENGAAKYGDRNWEKGIPESRYIDSAMRHLVKYVQGEDSEDNLAAAAWNIFCVMEFDERRRRGIAVPDIFDLPKPLQKKAKAFLL